MKDLLVIEEYIWWFRDEGPKPPNEQFENRIAEKLYSFNSIHNIFVEAESANIGKCKIPHEFFNQIKLQGELRF
ncbi:MAG: hypothetical protein Ct9H90mP3_6740 [Flammeovirgaceae bacterium]|nr:MAG: hypothetical protein Ct9H90mP3_6740 [Flammeovirgaceae bacterium]